MITILADIIQRWESLPWVFLGLAVALGGLRGLEAGQPGSMVRSLTSVVHCTMGQAITLALGLAISQAVVLGVLGGLGLQLAIRWGGPERYFQIVSGVIVAGLALWLLSKTRRRAGQPGPLTDGADTQTIQTGTGSVVLSIFQDGVPPVFRLRFAGGSPPPGAELRLQTVREDGAQQPFGLTAREGFLESTTPIPEPHNFDAVLEISYRQQSHTFIVPFRESPVESAEAAASPPSEPVAQSLPRPRLTTLQVLILGLTNGVDPAPAALAILLLSLCLQFREFSQVAILLGAFVVGLALALSAVAVLATSSPRQSGLGNLGRSAAYLSSGVLLLLSVYLIYPD